jgi:hypothetical protein
MVAMVGVAFTSAAQVRFGSDRRARSRGELVRHLVAEQDH